MRLLSIGIWAPREWPGLPPVDYISSLVTDINVPDNQLTTTVMNWGQFLAHDIIHTPTYQTRKLPSSTDRSHWIHFHWNECFESLVNNTHIQCCTPDSKHLPAKDTHPLCFPINVALDHSFYSKFGVQCHSFVRSVIAPRDDCKLGFANQVKLVLIMTSIWSTSLNLTESTFGYISFIMVSSWIKIRRISTDLLFTVRRRVWLVRFASLKVVAWRPQSSTITTSFCPSILNVETVSVINTEANVLLLVIPTIYQ